MTNVSNAQFPLIPLRDVVVFPQIGQALIISRPKSIAALEQALLQDDRRIVVVAQKSSECEDPRQSDIYQVGTLADVMQMLKCPDGTVRALVEGASRVGINYITELDNWFEVGVAVKEDITRDDILTKTLMRLAVEKFEQFVKASKKINPESLLAVSSVDQPGRLADIIATYLGLDMAERQHCLEIADSTERLEYISHLLSRELELVHLEQQIHDRVRFNLEKTQKEYYLREKMRIIQDELNSDGEQTGEIAEYKQKIAEAKITGIALEKAQKELQRLGKNDAVERRSRCYQDLSGYFSFFALGQIVHARLLISSVPKKFLSKIIMASKKSKNGFWNIWLCANYLKNHWAQFLSGWTAWCR